MGMMMMMMMMRRNGVVVGNRLVKSLSSLVNERQHRNAAFSDGLRFQFVESGGGTKSRRRRRRRRRHHHRRPVLLLRHPTDGGLFTTCSSSSATTTTTTTTSTTSRSSTSNTRSYSPSSTYCSSSNSSYSSSSPISSSSSSSSSSSRWSLESLANLDNSKSTQPDAETARRILQDVTQRLQEQHDRLLHGLQPLILLDSSSSPSPDYQQHQHQQQRQAHQHIHHLLYVYQDTLRLCQEFSPDHLTRWNHADQVKVSSLLQQVRDRHATLMERFMDLVLLYPLIQPQEERDGDHENTTSSRARQVEAEIQAILQARWGILLLCDHYVKLTKATTTAVNNNNTSSSKSTSSSSSTSSLSNTSSTSVTRGAVSVHCPILPNVVREAITEATHICDAHWLMAPECQVVVVSLLNASSGGSSSLIPPVGDDNDNDDSSSNNDDSDSSGDSSSDDSEDDEDSSSSGGIGVCTTEQAEKNAATATATARTTTRVAAATNTTTTTMTATVIRPWLHHVLVELLKNAMQATLTKHHYVKNSDNNNMENDDEVDPPPIIIEAAYVYSANNDSSPSFLQLDIIDDGVGLPFQDHHISGHNVDKNELVSLSLFKLGQSSITTRWDRLQEQQSYATVRSPMNSLGVGLPISRMMMQYFGGNVKLFNNHNHKNSNNNTSSRRSTGCTARITIPLDTSILEQVQPLFSSKKESS